jgi:hypothetical protein
LKRFATVVMLSSIMSLANADEFPHRKPGLWEIATQSSNSQEPPMTQRICLDRETDELMYRQGAGVGPSCKKFEMHASGKSLTVSVVCDFGKSQLTSNGVTTFSGDTAYHTDVHGRFDPPMAGTGETHSVQDGKWTGACPADMKPGDMVMKTSRGEVRMNLRTALKP